MLSTGLDEKENCGLKCSFEHGALNHTASIIETKCYRSSRLVASVAANFELPPNLALVTHLMSHYRLFAPPQGTRSGNWPVLSSASAAR